MKCSIARREPSGLVWTAAGADGEDARAFAAAQDAILVLAAAQRGHALEVDDGVEPLGGQIGPGFHQRSGMLQFLVRLSGFAIRVEEHCLGKQGSDSVLILHDAGKLLVEFLVGGFARFDQTFLISSREESPVQGSTAFRRAVKPLVSSGMRGW